MGPWQKNKNVLALLLLRSGGCFLFRCSTKKVRKLLLPSCVGHFDGLLFSLFFARFLLYSPPPFLCFLVLFPGHPLFLHRTTKTTDTIFKEATTTLASKKKKKHFLGTFITDLPSRGVPCCSRGELFFSSFFVSCFSIATRLRGREGEKGERRP